jgi:hypothetical protein
MLRTLAFVFMALTAVSLIFWLFFSGKLSIINTRELNKGFSQFITLQETDEYVIAHLMSHEEFTAEQYRTLMGYPIGDTIAKLSLVANYKYYVNLSDLQLNAENDTVFIYAPKLYLSTPVAFEFSTVREFTDRFLFGPDKNDLLENLKQDVSAQLVVKGKSQIGAVYDKAAKALADNFYNYSIANGYGNHYKNIVVTFSDERSQSRRQFSYNKSFCGRESCSLELDLGKGLIFIIQ